MCTLNAKVRSKFIALVVMYNYRPVPDISKEFKIIYGAARSKEVDFFTVADTTSDEHMTIMHFIETKKAMNEYSDFVDAFDDYAAILSEYCTHKLDTHE